MVRLFQELRDIRTRVAQLAATNSAAMMQIAGIQELIASMRYLTLKRAALVAAGQLTEAQAVKLSVAACELQLMELGSTDCMKLELVCVLLSVTADEVARKMGAEKKQAATTKTTATGAP